MRGLGNPSRASFRYDGFRGLGPTQPDCRKSSLFCHSEQSEESLLCSGPGKEREIPRFARNDKKLGDIFRSLVRWQVANAAVSGRDYAWLIVSLNRLASGGLIVF